MMKLRRLATMLTLRMPALVAIVGCEETPTTPPPKPFELEGHWLYLGPADPGHDLTIGQGSMVYKGDDGTWSSNWTIKTHDNGQHHFQVAFDRGSGTYLPVGQNMSGTYDLMNGTFLTVEVANGTASYPPLLSPGTCTSAADGTPVPGCRLYTKN